MMKIIYSTEWNKEYISKYDYTFIQPTLGKFPLSTIFVQSKVKIRTRNSPKYVCSSKLPGGWALCSCHREEPSYTRCESFSCQDEVKVWLPSSFLPFLIGVHMQPQDWPPQSQKRSPVVLLALQKDRTQLFCPCCLSSLVCCLLTLSQCPFSGCSTVMMKEVFA